MDGGAWLAAVHGVAKSRTQLSDFTFTFHFHALEKEIATHPSVLAWRIPGTGEPGGLPSMGSHRVRHDWSDLAAATGSSQITRRLGHICVYLDSNDFPSYATELTSRGEHCGQTPPLAQLTPLARGKGRCHSTAAVTGPQVLSRLYLLKSALLLMGWVLTHAFSS